MPRTAIFRIPTSAWSRAPRERRFARCLERWDKGDNGILDYAKAYRLKPGTGWLVPPRILHAPGSLLTYEPQWGSDVLAMFQSMVEGRPVPRSLLTQDVPEDKHWDLDFLADLVDWPANIDASSRSTIILSRFRWPIPRARVISIAGSFTGLSTASRSSVRAS